MGRSEYELQPASHLLFERRPLVRDCADRRPGDNEVHGRRSVLVVGNQPPYHLTRREELALPRMEAPALTITSDPYNSIAVFGSSGPDWAIAFCAQADGENESEAHTRLQQISLTATGSTISLTGPGLYENQHRRGDLVVEGPTNAAVVVHGSYTSVDVRDMAAPVRIAATHARARILGTTGQLDVTAGVIDFAGSCGRVTLSAEAEINLKMTTKSFDGTLSAWAQRPVRMLVPPGFTTPIEVVVRHAEDFVNRTEFSSDVKQKRLGELYVFTLGVDDGGQNQAVLHLRSDESTVVIDTASGKP